MRGLTATARMNRVPILLVAMCAVALAVTIGIDLNLIPFGIPGIWVWIYNPNQEPLRLCFPLVGIALFTATALIPIRRLLRQPITRPNEWRALGALWLSSFSLTVGVALIHSWGFMHTAALVFTIGPNSYYYTALQHPNLLSLLNNFHQQMAGLPLHAQTQSAGPIVLCWALRRVFDMLPFLYDFADVLIHWSTGYNLIDAAAGWERVIHVSGSDLGAALIIGFFFMAVGSLTVVPLYYLGKWLYNAQVGIWAAAGFVLVPSFHLFNATVDQMYPFVACVALCLVTLAARHPQRGWLLLFLAGVWLSFAVFMNLGLLTLIVLCGVYAALIVHRKYLETSQKLWWSWGCAFAGGLAIPYLFLWSVFGYNLAAVFLTSNQLRVKLYANLNRAYWPSVFGNLLEFLISAGIPLSLLFLWHVYRSACSPARRSTAIAGSRLLWSYLFLLIFLDISGKALGEVARLWIFLTPCLVLMSVVQLRKLFPRFPLWSALLIACQILQLVSFPYFLRVHGF